MTMDSQWLLLAHLAVTLYMTGLIWFVQVVHYPLFDRVGRDAFQVYHAAHTRRTGWVVGPPMLIEAGTALWLLVEPPDGVPGWQPLAGVALLALIWLSTALLQVPQHRRLAGGFDATSHRRLVTTDRIRVIGWTLRALLVLSWTV